MCSRSWYERTYLTPTGNALKTEEMVTGVDGTSDGDTLETNAALELS